MSNLQCLFCDHSLEDHRIGVTIFGDNRREYMVICTNVQCYCSAGFNRVKVNIKPEEIPNTSRKGQKNAS